MCGIVGYLGLKNAVDVVLEGLRRLEYRGYDSAGVCFKDEEGILRLHKKQGKIINLESALEGVNTTSHSCIGHTRWATHGEVNDTNAHPHLSDSIAIDDDNSIAIVHNGIIENAEELKEELVAKGLRFTSQTDSEVFLGLMVDELRNGTDFFDAVCRSFKRIKGNSAFVLERKGSQEILAIKRGAPLVCGINKSDYEVLVSSDPYALAGFAEDLFFPEDDVLCRLSPIREEGISFFELDGGKSERILKKKMDMSVDEASKQSFEHYMLKEIFEQPQLIRFLNTYYAEGEGLKSLENLHADPHQNVHIVACGTAWHAGLVVKNFLEHYNRVPCSVELASEFRYRNPLIQPKDLGVFISQSGETADTLAAQELCKEAGIKTFGIVNVEGSTLFRNCDQNFLIRAGVEIGVASTKAFTLQVLTGRLISLAVTKAFHDAKVRKEMFDRFNLLANRIEDILKNKIELIRKVAESIYNQKGFIFTGRGKYWPIAFEGALKLKEIAYVHAEGYAAGELKHGPIALIDEEMVNIAIIGEELYDKTFSNVQEVKARKGIIVSIGPENDSRIEQISDHYIPLNFEGLEELSPLMVNVVNQLLSYYMAKFKGTDIDKPRNLAKSVTVE